MDPERPNTARRSARLLVMLSGSGRTLENLLRHTGSGSLDAEVAAVVANRDCLGLRIAREHAIPTELIPGGPDARVLDRLVEQHAIDWVILAGYLRLLPITDRTRGRIVNIHPALLPSFGGPGMHGSRVHEAVLQAARRGEVRESGCTVHYADDHYDTGRVIIQRRCPVHPDDTPERLAARVFELEREAYPEAIRRLISPA